MIMYIINYKVQKSNKSSVRKRKKPADTKAAALKDNKKKSWPKIKPAEMFSEQSSYHSSRPKVVGTHRASLHGSWLQSSSTEHRTDEPQPQAWHLGQGQYQFHPQQSKCPAIKHSVSHKTTPSVGFNCWHRATQGQDFS